MERIFMQTEFVQYVGYFLALSLTVYFVCCFIYGIHNKNVKPIKFSDKFELGYVEDNQTHIPIDVTVADVSEKELINKLENQLKSMQSKISKMEKQKTKKPKQKLEDSQLFNDCVTALMSLGYKQKTLAKKEVADFLSKNEISSAEQFIAEFFKKAKK